MEEMEEALDVPGVSVTRFSPLSWENQGWVLEKIIVQLFAYNIK